MRRISNEGGVEEKKEDGALSPHSMHEKAETDSTDEEESGFRAQMEAFAKGVFGSCGNAIEAATFFVQEKGCRWPVPADKNPCNPSMPKGRGNGRQPLSVAEELRKLAMAEGRDISAPLPRERPDIPRFLGEEAVYSFEDDNISAISQHTLEEMARRGIIHPMCRKPSNGSLEPPAPVRTNSSSSRSRRRSRETKCPS